jgi:predicted house-cleaning noncanonical NTP pyrophosphatase (MazG superfamily)
MIGKLKDLTINRDGTQNITITIQEDFREEFDNLLDKDVKVEIKKFSRSRSMDANNYAWAIIDKIAEKMNMKKSEVYRNAIRDIGGVSTLIGLKDEAIEPFRKSWEANHLGRQIEVVPGSNKEGWQNVRVYFGSSEFDTAQMSRLINSLIQDAESLGIPTMTEAEQERILLAWGKKIEKKKSVA